MIYRFDTLGSTNDEARGARYRAGDVVWAEEQSAGRGQRGHLWSAARGENLTFSVVLEPRFLAAAEQFLLSEAVALALVGTAADCGIATRIKWTNDLYAGDRKLAGVLIEHDLSGGMLARTVVGVGLNVNQTRFDPALPNPVSMAQLTGRRFDRREVLERFLGRLGEEVGRLGRGGGEELQRDYGAHLYRLGERRPYRFADGTVLEAVLEGVRPSGALVLRLPDGTRGEYLFREAEFVIPRAGER